MVIMIKSIKSSAESWLILFARSSQLIHWSCLIIRLIADFIV